MVALLELAWDQAVNDTANLWQSILWNTFGPVRAARMYGILAPVELQVACLSTGQRTE